MPAGIGTTSPALAQTLFGAPGWVAAMRDRILRCARAGRIAGADRHELPALRRLRPRPTLEHVLAAVAAATAIPADAIRRPRARHPARTVAIYLARHAGGHSLHEIDAAFGMRPSGASKAVTRLARALTQHEHLRHLLAELHTALQLPVPDAIRPAPGGPQSGAPVSSVAVPQPPG